jgi:hypothetical protein
MQYAPPETATCDTFQIGSRKARFTDGDPAEGSGSNPTEPEFSATRLAERVRDDVERSLQLDFCFFVLPSVRASCPAPDPAFRFPDRSRRSPSCSASACFLRRSRSSAEQATRSKHTRRLLPPPDVSHDRWEALASERGLQRSNIDNKSANSRTRLAAAGNTSEFSACVAYVNGTIFADGFEPPPG